MTFQPSRFSASSASYGFDEDRYAAQLMLTEYRQGLDVGDSYGFVGALIASVASAGVGFANIVHESTQAKKGREHEVTMAKEERKTLAKQAELVEAEAELAALEAETAKAQTAGTVALASWLGGSIMLIGLVGVGIYAASRAGEP